MTSGRDLCSFQGAASQCTAASPVVGVETAAAAGPSREKIGAAQISALYSGASATGYFPFFVMVVVVIFNAGSVPLWVGGVLLGLHLCGKLVLGRLRRAYERVSAAEVESRTWAMRHTLVSGAIGAVWGAVGYIYYGAGDVEHQALLMILLLGVLTAGVLTMLSHLPAYYAFAAGLVTPLLIQILRGGDPRSWVLFGTCIAFLGALSLLVRMLHRREQDNLELAFANVSLREALEQSQQEAYAARDQAVDSYARTSQLLDNAQRLAGLGSWDFDPQRGELFWSDHYRRMLEYPADMAPSFEAMRARIHAEDRARVDDVIERMGEVSDPVRLEFRQVTPQRGTRHVVERIEHQIGDDGKTTRISAVLLDVTDQHVAELTRMRSEEYMRTVLESVSDIIAIIAKDGTISFTNHAIEQVLGHSAEDMLGRNVLEIVHEDDRPMAGELLLNGALERNSRHPAVLRMQAGDGDYREMEFLGRDLTSNPMVGGTVVLARDISMRKQTELQLRRAKDEAEMASMAKSHFLANMSHELRTPLNAILGFSELIETEALGPVGNDSYLEYIGDIRRSGAHLLGLINDILDLSRIEAGRETLREEELDLRRALEGCVRLIAPRREEAGVEILIDMTETTPTLWVDRRKFNQIVINVLSNAVKFTPSGGRITISYLEQLDGGIKICIRDTGIGMRAEDIPLVLQPFSQVDSSETRRYEGAGLGLSICQALVRLHGGELGIQSAPGAGTTVSITMPAERVHRPVSGPAMGEVLYAVRHLPPAAT